IYVHVPFCAARCPYCDFATAPATSRLRARYVAALVDEIAREGVRLGRPRVHTLYVGGVTPSLLEPEEIASLGAALRLAFELRPREATVEANPATLDRARLKAWIALGITRASIGAQSFSPEGLRALGRAHQPEDTAVAVAAIREEGLDVNLDLIFGWPGQSEAAWRRDLASGSRLAWITFPAIRSSSASIPRSPSRTGPGAAGRSCGAGARAPPRRSPTTPRSLGSTASRSASWHAPDTATTRSRTGRIRKRTRSTTSCTGVTASGSASVPGRTPTSAVFGPPTPRASRHTSRGSRPASRATSTERPTPPARLRCSRCASIEGSISVVMRPGSARLRPNGSGARSRRSRRLDWSRSGAIALGLRLAVGFLRTRSLFECSPKGRTSRHN